MKNRTFITFILLLALVLCGCRAADGAGAAANTGGSVQTIAAGSLILEEQAKTIALTHAGLTAGEVTFSRTEYELDDGRPEYEIEFCCGNLEYDYTIHAETGAVLSWDKEYDPPETHVATTEPSGTEPGTAQPQKVTEEVAKAIALAHAELTEGDVTWIRAEYGVDDGVPEYDVEFRQGNYEYEYEIHAETGAVLSWDKELDD